MKHIGVIAVSILVFFLQGPSYIYHMLSRLPGAGDSIINAWILAWDAHAIFDPGRSVWDSPLFYPMENALALSETLFGNLWITLPLQYLTGNHVLAANILLVVSFVLSAWAVYLLAYELTGNYWASLAAGVLFSFNPYRWFHAQHLQLLPIFWTPLAFLFAIRFFRKRDRVSFSLMLLMIWIQYYTCIYLGTMLAVTLVVFTSFYFLFGEKGRDRFRLVLDPKMLRLMISGLAASLIVLLPLGWPYMQTARTMSYFRSISENNIYSAEPLSFLFGIPYNSAAWGFLQNIPFKVMDGEGAVFLGLVPISLLIVNRILNVKRGGLYSEDQKLVQRSFFWTGLILMVLMLGPNLILLRETTGMPMPYQVVYHLFPGAQAMRVPARYFQLLLLCVSVLAAFTIAGVMKNTVLWAGWKKWGGALLFIGILWFDYSLVNDEGALMDARNEMPPVYSYLAEGDKSSPILEIPIKGNEHIYLHYQTRHWRPKIGGVSGWVPQSIERLAKLVKNGPTKKAFRLIERSGAETLVIHLNRYDEKVRDAWGRADLKPLGFNLAGRFEDALVWEKTKLNSVDSVLKLK